MIICASLLTEFWPPSLASSRGAQLPRCPIGNRNWIHPNAGNSLIRQRTIISDMFVCAPRRAVQANVIRVIPIIRLFFETS